MHTLNCDIETFSDVDLLKCGVYAYADSPNFEILLFAYSVDGAPVEVVDLAQGEELPVEICQALTDPAVQKVAYNANFERTCIAAHYGIEQPPEEWKCTAVDASRLGLPGNLAGVAQALKLDVQKDSTGKALIRYFSLPCKPTKTNGGRTRNLPEHDLDKWQQYKDYNRIDVEVEMAIRKKIDPALEVQPEEQALWSLDQRINDRGVQLDRVLVDQAIACNEEFATELMNHSKWITNLANPNSRAQLLEWLKENGAETETLRKDDVERMLTQDIPDDVRTVLEHRQELSRASVSKYKAMERSVCSDGRVKGLLQFYGAGRTGRWAGRIVQVQNLTKNYIPDIENASRVIKAGNFEAVDLLFKESKNDILSQLVRTALVASPGNRLIVSDFSAIEARVIAWFANEKWRLKVFETHGKIYEASAAEMFSVPIESITKGSDLRQRGKVAELACIAEGQEVLTDKGLIPIELVSTEHKVWDGLNFVSHQGVIYKGEREVMEYEGLTATADHIVWVEGQSEPIPLGEAASSGAHLLQPRTERQNIRVDRNYKRGKNLYKTALAGSYGSGTMYRLSGRKLGILQQLKTRDIERLSSLLPAPSDTQMAGPEIHSSETTLHQSERRRLQKLRRSGNRVPVRICIRSRIVDDRESRSPGKTYGDRSIRCKRALRTRESTLGNAPRKLPEPKKVYDILEAGPLNRFTVSGVLVHNCGYGGGVGALKAMGALDMGLAEGDLQGLIDAWRRANKNIVRFWYACNTAAIEAIEGKTTVKTPNLVFQCTRGILYITLPSGRKLAYVKPRIIEGRFGQPAIEFDGLNSVGKWGPVETYGAKIVENIVQATARDCLAYSMLNVDAAGYEIVMHVHDELVTDTPYGFGSLAEVEEIMAQPIPWAPGLPLNADGFETEFYMKD